jgi:ribokinase
MRVKVADFTGPDLFSQIDELSYGAGGSAANVAIGVTRLGGTCTLVGKIGLDNFGRMIVDELVKEKVSLDYIKTDLLLKTGLTIVIINSTGEILMYGDKGASEALQPEDVAYIRPKGCEYVHIASLRMDTSLAAADLSKRSGLFVTFDPGRELATRGIDHIRPIFGLLDLLLLNIKEARLLTACDEPEKAGAALNRAGVKNVIVKLGGGGIHFSGELGKGTLPAFRVKAVDTTGAGDAFATGLLLSLGNGSELKEALRYASAVAALKVTRLGSHAIPTAKEVEELLASQPT